MARRFPPILQENHEARKADTSQPFAKLKHVEFSPVNASPPITPKTLIFRGECQLRVVFSAYFGEQHVSVTYQASFTSPTWEDAGAFVDHILHTRHKDNTHVFMEDVQPNGTAHSFTGIGAKAKNVPLFEIWMGS